MKSKGKGIKKLTAWLVCAALIGGSLPGVAFAETADALDIEVISEISEEDLSAGKIDLSEYVEIEDPLSKDIQTDAGTKGYDQNVESANDATKMINADDNGKAMSNDIKALGDEEDWIDESFDDGIMMLTETPSNAIVTLDDNDVVAEINGTGYATVQAAVDAADSGDTVTMIADSKETISISADKDIILDLNGCTLDGDGKGSVITNGGTLTLTDSSGDDSGCITGGDAQYGGGINNSGTFIMTSGTITGNSSTASSIGGGGGVYNSADCTFIMEDGSIDANSATVAAGGVYNAGSFIMKGGTISGNTAKGSSNLSGGAGVYNDSGEFIMEGGIISENTDESTKGGGGIYSSSNSVFIMKDGVISENTTKRSGGGVYNLGTFTMEGGTICENTAVSYWGGGVCNSGSSSSTATFTMINGDINGNSGYGGGGVYNSNYSTFIMENGSISGNQAKTYGGGVNSVGNFMMKDGNISENTAGSSGGGIYGSGTFIVEGGSISGNTSGTAGGVYVRDSGIFYMIDGSISGNSSTTTSSTGGGGGIGIVGNAEFDMIGGSISENSAVTAGGVRVSDNGIFILEGGSISGNTSTSSGSGTQRGNGGGIYLCDSGTLIMTEGSISGNLSYKQGADIYSNSDSCSISLIAANTMSDDTGKDFSNYAWFDDSGSTSDPDEYTGEAISDELVSAGSLALVAAEKGSLTYCVDGEERETDAHMAGVTVTIRDGKNFDIDSPHFLGWSTTEDSIEAEYVANDSYILDAGNTVLYAAYSDHDWIETEEVEAEENRTIVHITITCNICGETRHETVIIETEGDGIEVEDDLTWEDLIDDSEFDDYFFEDDEKIEVEVTVTDDNDSVSEADKATAEEAIEELWPGEDHSDFYFDIEVEVDIYDSDGELEKTVIIEESVNPGTFTVTIPDDLLRAPGDTYTVIVVHDGEAVALETIDNGDGTLTFTTDKFDGYTYVIVKTGTGLHSRSVGSSSRSSGSSSSDVKEGAYTNVMSGRTGHWILEGALLTLPDGSHPSNEYLKVGDEIWAFYTNGYAVNKRHADYYTEEAVADAGEIPEVTGTWDVIGWWFEYDDGTYPYNEWVELEYNGRTDWYHFDIDGWMDDGWFTENGITYYLDPVYDGWRGHMVTGWQFIDGYWYYFESNGSLLKSGTTPDGYTVDGNGRWVE